MVLPATLECGSRTTKLARTVGAAPKIRKANTTPARVRNLACMKNSSMTNGRRTPAPCVSCGSAVTPAQWLVRPFCARFFKLSPDYQIRIIPSKKAEPWKSWRQPRDRNSPLSSGWSKILESISQSSWSCNETVSSRKDMRPIAISQYRPCALDHYSVLARLNPLGLVVRIFDARKVT